MIEDIAGELLFLGPNRGYACIGVLISLEKDVKMKNTYTKQTYETYVGKYFSFLHLEPQTLSLKEQRETSFFVLDNNNEMKRWYE